MYLTRRSIWSPVYIFITYFSRYDKLRTLHGKNDIGTIFWYVRFKNICSQTINNTGREIVYIARLMKFWIIVFCCNKLQQQGFIFPKWYELLYYLWMLIYTMKFIAGLCYTVCGLLIDQVIHFYSLYPAVRFTGICASLSVVYLLWRQSHQ